MKVMLFLERGIHACHADGEADRVIGELIDVGRGNAIALVVATGGQATQRVVLALATEHDAPFADAQRANGLQIDGETKDVMPTEPLDKKFESFGWHVIKIDGHDFDQIEAAYKEAEQTKGQPTMILAKTIKGKGVSFMENNAGWHGKAPNDEQWAQAKAELEAQIKELEG